MLVYEKKVDSVRHIFGTEANVPSADDVQLTYLDDQGEAISDLTLNETYLDNGQGGIKRKSDGEDILVFIGETNIVPGKSFEKAMTGIEVTTPPTKTTYEVDEALDLTGMVVKGFYNDGTNEVITGWEADPEEGTLLQKDDDSVMIEYGEFYDEIAITVGDGK